MTRYDGLPNISNYADLDVVLVVHDHQPVDVSS